MLPPATDAFGRFFNGVDGLLKFAERCGPVPFRALGLRRAERWTVERQEATGDWGGIIPAMLNAMLALRALGYAADDPVVVRGFAALDGFTIRSADDYRVQPCISPVWDTGLAVRALVDGGVPRDDARLVRAATWLLEKQIVSTYGDWAVKNRTGEPGGWAFEFENRWYPDVDDTAVVAMALAAVEHPDAQRVDGALARGAVGGKHAVPHRRVGRLRRRQRSRLAQPHPLRRFEGDDRSEHGRRHRPRARDGRALRAAPRAAALCRALAYLLAEQEADGAWWGRWGVNFIYGTSGALAALGCSRRRRDSTAPPARAARAG